MTKADTNFVRRTLMAMLTEQAIRTARGGKSSRYDLEQHAMTRALADAHGLASYAPKG